MNGMLFTTMLGSTTIITVCTLFIAEYLQDVRHVRKHKQLASHPASTKLPFITVMLQTHNDLPYLDASIASVLCSTYPDFELILVDNGSVDGTATHLKKLATQHPRYIKKTIIRRKPQPLNVRELTRRHATGDVVVAMALPHALDKRTLRQIAVAFAVQHDLGLLELRSQQSSTNWLLKTAKKYAELTTMPLRKLISSKSPEAIVDTGIFAMHRTRSKTKTFSTGFASGAFAVGLRAPLPLDQFKISFRLSVPNTSARRLRPVKLPSAVLPILFISYLLAAIITQNVSYFLYGWVIFTASLLVSITGDKDMSPSRKLRYLLHIIPAYLLYCGYYMSAALRRLYRLTKRSQASS